MLKKGKTVILKRKPKTLFTNKIIAFADFIITMLSVKKYKIAPKSSPIKVKPRKTPLVCESKKAKLTIDKSIK